MTLLKKNRGVKGRDGEENGGEGWEDERRDETKMI